MFKYAILFALPLTVACDGAEPVDGTDDAEDTDTEDTDSEQELDAIEIAGTWEDGFGAEHVITEQDWTINWAGGSDPSLFLLADVSNDEDWAIAENDENNEYDAGLYSRFDWYDDGTTLWMCQTAFDAESEQAARDVRPADTTDPATGGCGGFAWSELTGSE